jgi:hypothetical protein
MLSSMPFSCSCGQTALNVLVLPRLIKTPNLAITCHCAGGSCQRWAPARCVHAADGCQRQHRELPHHLHHGSHFQWRSAATSCAFLPCRNPNCTAAAVCLLHRLAYCQCQLDGCFAQPSNGNSASLDLSTASLSGVSSGNPRRSGDLPAVCTLSPCYRRVLHHA